jgi:hypothetical protein
MTFAIGKRILPKPGERTPTPEPPLPPMIDQARNYVRSLIRSAEGIIAGHSFFVSDATANIRAQKCRSNVCGRYRSSDDACSKCGCPIGGKTKRFAEFCPDHPRQWGPGEMTGEANPST